MDIFSNRLRERAQQLGISNAEAARRCGLDERRYAHYVTGRREPDLDTLVRIARSLGTSPNWLLGEDGEASAKGGLLDRLMMAAVAMSDPELSMTVVQAEAVARESG
jgi:transcriptional regulator with XRE-family HTH domain